uniref:transposase n=1 Tax=Tetragenococcus halophilus TaxID=51669 RepID=UPI00295F57B5
MYKQCECRGAHYVIKLKNNVRLIHYAQHLVQYTNGTDYTKTEHQYFKMAYQADSWDRSRTVAIKATRKAETLLFSEFQFVVSDFAHLSPQTIFQLYQK